MSRRVVPSYNSAFSSAGYACDYLPLVLIGCGLLYVLSGSFIMESRVGATAWPRFRLVPAARRHLALLGALIFGLMAWGAWLTMVQTLLTQTIYLDPVVDDWAHIKAPTLVFGGAEDSLPGSSAIFKERMKFVSETIPNRNATLLLIPGIGHVPHMEAPEKTYPPLLAFLKEGISKP